MSKRLSEDSGFLKKRAKISDFRSIAVESDSAAIRSGEIDVNAFLNSRKFEIRALFQAMKRSRQLSAQRAFQSLPRFLRRRAASHNLKRIPKRLRARAKNEINNKSVLTKGKIKGKKRSRLLTAHKLKRIGSRSNITFETTESKLNENEEFPRVKKVSGRFSRRQIDKTWLPTHLWHVKRAKMLTKWFYSIAKTPTQKSYRSTHKFANKDGAIAFDMSYYCTICLWGEMENLKRVLEQFTISDSGITKGRYIRGTRFCEAMIYKKDSDFLQIICPAYFLWQKIGNSQCVMIRFHPVAFEQVYFEIKEVSNTENVTIEDCRFDIGSIDIHGPMSTLALQCLFDVKTSDTMSQIWSEIKYVSQIRSLPIGIVIPLNIRDPRLSFPPRIKDIKSGVICDPLIKSWKDDLIPSSELFNTDVRSRCQKNQLSQKSINVLRSESSESSVPYDIPVLLLRCEICWTILAPWDWITHLWYSLMHIPKVCFGGMQEKHQLEFEEGRPYFPSDYHGTLAGNETEKAEGEYRESEWKKRPPAKRVSWSCVVTKDGKGEHGNPFICDWNYLFLKNCESNFKNNENECKVSQTDFHLISGADVREKIDSDAYKFSNFIFIVKITMLQRGRLNCCARVYSIPVEEKDIWERFSKKIVKYDDEEYPLCPSSYNLLGFVTTGNFNLKRGKTTGIGCFSLHSISKELINNKEKYCIVRNVGCSTVNIAKNFGKGSIVRLSLEKFVTYDSIEFYPGPNLNMIIGPNGSGKSTFVCAICIGLGWSPSFLGRAKDINEYIKFGSEMARIEIELKGTDEGPNILVSRVIYIDNTSTWELNGVSSNHKHVREKMDELNIQIDNLCQFLPQDKVSEFAQLTPEKLLRETERAVGDSEMLLQHDKLIDLRISQKNDLNAKIHDQSQLENLIEKQAITLRDVERFREREAIIKTIKILEYKIPFVRYLDSRKAFYNSKNLRNEKKAELDKIEKEYAPFLEKKNELEITFNKCVMEKNKIKDSLNNKYGELDSFISSFEKYNDSIKEIRSEIRAEKRKERERTQRIQELKEAIPIMESRLGNKPSKDNLNVILDELTKANDSVKKIKKELEDLNMNIEEHMHHIEESKITLNQVQNKLTDLDNIREQRLQWLRQNDRDVYDAVIWLSNNRNKFKDHVYGPVYLEVSVKDLRYADFVEACFQKNTYMAFTFLNRDDYVLFNRMLVDSKEGCGRELRLHTTEFSNTSAPNLDMQKCPYSSNELKQNFGMDGYLLDFLDGPSPVLNTLCHIANIHRIPVSIHEISDVFYKKLSQCVNSVNQLVFPVFISGRTHYTMKKSKYGRMDVSTITKLVTKAQRFTTTVNIETKKILQRQIMDLNSVIKKNENSIQELKKIEERVKTRFNDAVDRKNDLLKKKEGIQKEIKEWDYQALRLEKTKEDLRSCDSLSNISFNNIKKLKEKMKEIVEKYTVSAIQLKDLTLNTFQITNSMVCASIREIQENDNYFEIVKKNEEIITRIDDTRNSYEELKNTTQELKNIATEKLEIVQKSLENVDEEIRKEMENACIYMTEELLNEQIDFEKGKLEFIYQTNPNVISQFEKREHDIKILKKRISEIELRLQKTESDINGLKAIWEPKLDDIIYKINSNFSEAFEYIGCVGEVRIGKSDEFDKWRVEILVKFRDNENLQPLTAQRQSGGERSVSTIFYLIAMQSLSKAPFRVVDEINQGMDSKNERLVHAKLVDAMSKKNTSQCFLITPKLLPSLQYSSNMRILCVCNGDLVIQESKSDMRKYIELIRELKSKK
ncbi:hypothetical protein PORY_001277 [Pneumocystis oryctolagi]|uniref:Uncharacterized protein n=1 Tax=Pneumocystis oryctolagi TaxID=42067 RepID=A0ACB7CDF3_9ASCO|nr:hypothetical protein PORY_001277 [Pneumocystis oryctolagi]